MRSQKLLPSPGARKPIQVKQSNPWTTQVDKDGYTHSFRDVVRLDVRVAEEMWAEFERLLPLQKKDWYFVQIEYWDGGRFLFYRPMGSTASISSLWK